MTNATKTGSLSSDHMSRGPAPKTMPGGADPCFAIGEPMDPPARLRRR